MIEKMKARCIYCGGDVYYHSGQQLIKCEWCGQTLMTAKFENELIRMKKTEEENALVKKQLARAEKEKQAADDRLFAALSSLGEIRDEQDALGKILHMLAADQGEELENLQFMKDIAAKLVSSQEDIFARMSTMQEIAAHLQQIDMDAQKRQSVMNDFVSWSQQIRKEDLQRLNEIEVSAGQLLEGQRETCQKVSQLQQAAGQHQQTLEAFRGQYTKDKLKEMQKLYRQAEGFQHDKAFDKAEKYYRKVLTRGNDDAEVYWRLVMCHYCLTYQKDDEGRMIPIILNPDLTDPAEMSIRRDMEQNLTAENRRYYLDHLEQIDRILDKYRLLKDRVQYDVFISVKQNRDGHYTSDSDVAADLYDFLTDQGLRVFNSRRTTIPAGQEYEPYIISALMSAKAMIVVGTNPENMNAQWVKNEWSRFQWLQRSEKEKTGKTDRLLVCYLAKGMQAKEIPKALNPNKQAIFDGVKAHDELLAGLSFLLKSGKQAVPGKEKMIVKENIPAEFDIVRNQLTIWLSLGNYEKVEEKYEQLTEAGLHLEQADLHLAALCAQKKVSGIGQIVHSEVKLEEEVLYKLAVRLCKEGEEKDRLRGLAEENRTWNAWKNESAGKMISKSAAATVPKTAEKTAKKTAAKPAKKTAAKNKTKKESASSEEESADSLYEKGWKYSKDGMPEEAFACWLKAAQQKNLEAIRMVALCCETGRGVLRNRKEAFNWYKKAAAVGTAEDQIILAEHYEKGIGVTKNRKTAAQWYRKAAESGSAEGQYHLGRCYQYGIGLEVDYYAANEWFHRAADAGYPGGCAGIGISYANGWGNLKDNTMAHPYCVKARDWLLQKAEDGDMYAQYMLGCCYEKGLGVIGGTNKKLAIEWYDKSSDQGLVVAAQSLERLTKKKFFFF